LNRVRPGSGHRCEGANGWTPLHRARAASATVVPPIDLMLRERHDSACLSELDEHLDAP
jgi:hypothetical protein